ncbi:CHASE2 and HATPase_c domain-containing protein [Kangiella shandongensis]|uniref:CHASE2 and HATPase_c domain-containing protein n=1 Tax=Kangiella shandongensis TaxID=2763258 RepID=UPI001CC13CDF|nr:CHASE2 and HATPase_c domain-containing protein [Kangiella shandongensis]
MVERRRFFTKGGLVFATFLAVIVFALSYFKVLEPVELLIYDRLLRAQPTEYASDVVVVAMDEKSLRAYGSLPWKRQVHAEAITRLTEAGVRAIGYDVLFDKPRDDGDTELTQAVRQSGQVVFPVVIDELKQDGQLIELQPYPELSQASAELGLVHFELSNDNIARSVYLKAGLGEPYWRTFAAEVLEVANGDPTYELPFKPREKAEYSYNLSNIEKTHYALIPYKKNKDYFPKISFVDLVNGAFDPKALEGKVVFVGVTATAARNADFLPVPVNRDGQIMSGVEINATLYEALEGNTIIRPVNQLAVSGISGVLVLLLFMLIPRSLPRHNVLLLAVMALGLLFISWFILHRYNFWLPLATPGVVMILGYLLWVWRVVVTNMAFFRKTVRRLQLEVSNSFEPDVKSSHEQHFKFWQRLHIIRDWSKATKNIVDSERSLPLTIDNERWLLELENLSQEEQRLFYRLYRQSTMKKQSDTLKQGSVIEAKVAQVQTAITKINFLRRFVEKTMDKMSDGVMLLDTSGVVFYANLEARKYLNIGEGQDAFDIFKQLNLQFNASWADEIKALLLDGVGREVQALNRTKHYFKIGLSLLDNIDGQDFIIVNLTDITSVKREQQRQLEMIDFISHDLRSPMTSVLALISRYRTKPEEVSVSELNSEIERLTKSSLSLAEHFLMLSRAESDSEMPLYPVELLNSIDNALVVARPLADEKSITLRFEFAKYYDTWIQANEDLLERVILNLLTNAIKYSPAESQVDIRIEQSNHGVKVLVSDQGEGIDKEQMNTIFKPFSRIRRHEMEKIKGIGLGLRFVKAAMERFGGTVGVESQIGKGSCFILSFPAESLVDD